MSPEIELALLWSGEGDDINIQIEGPYHGNAGSVAVFLTSDSTNRHDIDRHGADDVTLCWSFYGDTFADAVQIALEFARDLAVLAAVALDDIEVTG